MNEFKRCKISLHMLPGVHASATLLSKTCTLSSDQSWRTRARMYKSALGNSSLKKSPVHKDNTKVTVTNVSNYVKYLTFNKYLTLNIYMQTCLRQTTPCCLCTKDGNVHSSQQHLAGQKL